MSRFDEGLNRWVIVKGILATKKECDQCYPPLQIIIVSLGVNTARSLTQKSERDVVANISGGS